MASRRLTTLFAVLAVAPLLLLAARAACDLPPAPAAGSDDAAVCCTSVKHGDAFARLDLASPGPSSKALGAPLAAGYTFAGAASLLGVALLSAGAPLRARSFYARSARILR